MGARRGAAAVIAGLAIAVTACSDPAEPDSPSPSSSPSSSSSASSPSETPSPTYLSAGDLPKPLTLKAVRGRTLPAEPFADFAVAAGDGVWVSGVAPGAVRYDAQGRITAKVKVRGAVVQALADDGPDVLVPSLTPSLLLRLDAATGEERARVKLPASPVAEAVVGAAYGRAYVLVEPSEPRIAVVEGSKVVEEIPGPDGAVAVRAGYGSLWVPTSNHTVERLDLRTQKWTSIPVGPSPRFLDVGFGAVWVMDQGDGSVTRIDARSGKAEQIAVTGLRIGGGDLTVGAGGVWLRTDNSVARIDPRTRAVTHLIELPPGSASAAAVDGMLLITNHDHDAVHVVPLPLQG
ncbi:hypothetical protein ACS3YM_14915 [Nocardia sp. N13]|uniref:hypothetical protein n=1 Tax=Nocardioides sp. N13(2025) TaxID=3453405 RepID=UPI003F7712BB